ncbi:unnamed protein product, partial [Discosporangium mesarthrocarpum]
VNHQARAFWRRMGATICRLLRMSDFWHNFITDGVVSRSEMAGRRIAVLRQARLGLCFLPRAALSMKSLVGVFAEKYPASVWGRFRKLMRQLPSERSRRDMSVCATLVLVSNNPFFSCTGPAAGWSHARLVDLITGAFLIEKQTLAVLYEEGDWAGTGPGAAEDRDCGGSGSCGNRAGEDTGLAAREEGGRGEAKGLVKGDGTREGRKGGVGEVACHKAAGEIVEKREGQEVGAFIILRGAVDLIVLERRSVGRHITAEAQAEIDTRAARGQRVYSPRAPKGRAFRNVNAGGEGGNGGVNFFFFWTGDRLRAQFFFSFGGRVHGRDGAPSPRGASFRCLTPRWKACRLGPGALFGQQTGPGTHGGPSTTTARREGASEGQGGARGGARPRPTGGVPETAVAAEQTVLLQVGKEVYNKLLADWVKEKMRKGVSVLRATGALVRGH